MFFHRDRRRSPPSAPKPTLAIKTGSWSTLEYHQTISPRGKSTFSSCVSSIFRSNIHFERAAQSCDTSRGEEPQLPVAMYRMSSPIIPIFRESSVPNPLDSASMQQQQAVHQRAADMISSSPDVYPIILFNANRYQSLPDQSYTKQQDGVVNPTVSSVTN